MKCTRNLCIYTPYIIFSSVFWTIRFLYWLHVMFVTVVLLHLVCQTSTFYLMAYVYQPPSLYRQLLHSTKHLESKHKNEFREVAMAYETEPGLSIAASDTKGMVPNSVFANNLLLLYSSLIKCEYCKLNYFCILILFYE